MADDPDPKKEQNKAEPSEGAKRTRGILTFLAFALGLVVILVMVGWAVGWDKFLADRTNPESEDAYANGTERPLGARVTGYVTQVLVTDNQPVQAGQLLMVLEDDDYRAAYAQAQATVASADATLNALRQQIAAQEATLARTRTLTNSTAAQASFAGQEAARQRHILGSDLGVPRNAQQADAAHRVALADVGRTRSDTEEAAAQSVTLLAGLAQAQAARDLAAARAELARLDLAYTRIVAPQAGVLGELRVHLGSLVATGDTLVTLTPLNEVWVTGYFNERQLAHVLIGNPVRLKFDAYPDVRLPGHVAAIGPLTAQQFSAVPPDNVTGNYTKVIQRVPIKITIDPATNSLAGRLRPGLSVLARIDTTRGAEPVPGVRTAR